VSIQDTETVVAVGQEWTHPQFVSQDESLAVEGFGLLDCGGSTMCSNLAEEAQGIRLVATFLVRLGMRQRSFGKSMRLLRRPASRCASPREKLQSA
jgi:hypothetical protein